MEKEEEKVIDQNTEPAVEDNEEVLNPEEETLAQTDEVIPAPEETVPADDGTFPMGGIEVPPVEDETLAQTDEVIPAPEAPVEEIPLPPAEDVVEPLTVEEPIPEPIPEMPATPEDEMPVEPGDETPVDPVAEEPVSSECPSCEGEGCPACEGAVRVADVFGTLQEAVTIIWRYHLKTKKYSNHIALHEFYDKALDLVDDIIERYQGINGIIEDQYTNCVCPGDCEVDYLNSLRDFINTNKFVVGDHSELQSSFDDILGLIDTTLYKLTSFCESEVKSYEQFVYEDYVKGM